MDVTRSKKLFTLALTALFLCSAVPAGAEVVGLATGEIDLQLETALSDIGDDLFQIELDSPEDAVWPSEPVRIASLNSVAVREMWRSPQAVSEQTTQSSSSTDKKWFKKKKWWIPVLVAVVAGAALSDGDGDDTLDDGED